MQTHAKRAIPMHDLQFWRINLLSKLTENRLPAIQQAHKILQLSDQVNRVEKCFHIRPSNIVSMQTRRNGKLSTDNLLDIRRKYNWSPVVRNNRIQHQVFHFDFPHLRVLHILRVVLQNRKLTHVENVLWK